MGNTDCGVSWGDARITDLDFADDIAIFAETLEALVTALDTLSIESRPLGLKVSWIKTKIQKFVGFFVENNNLLPPVAVQGEPVSFVDNFVYLGSAIGSGGDLFRRSIDVWEFKLKLDYSTPENLKHS